jgi:hypothetical protein
MAARRKAQSPYQKYGKQEWRYSTAYNAWKRAIMAGNTRAADEASRDHAAQFGYRRARR